ncbi:MAG: hypothetical protein AB1762_06055 [Gemmatimonadota bacterium]
MMDTSVIRDAAVLVLKRATEFGRQALAQKIDFDAKARAEGALLESINELQTLFLDFATEQVFPPPSKPIMRDAGGAQ